ncbi:host-nuclease inhibitor Gam family protein [Thauera sp.]|uniref:host-nuclease inhibitor Gam family protein n=1 Tax=Thauera sp. TaxID=1905334 RepID=UPI00257FB511|nr:host-nuclease inhibitor Gam family protein [Thauera sp.]
MARKRMSATTLESWSDVDACLKAIAEVDRELAILETAQQEQIDAIKAATKTEAEPLQSKKAGLELAIQQYAEANRGEFIKAKTKELTFGSVSFRLSTRIVIKNLGNTLQALKDFGLTGCIRIKEECDKEAMKNLPIETIHAVGAALKQEDAFGYEVKRELIQEVV